MNKTILTTAFLSCLLLSGCAQGPSKTNIRQTKIDTLLRMESIKHGLTDGSIRYGLRAEELMGLIGKPDRVARMKTTSHYNEQWIYEDTSFSPPKQYIFHFEDGTLTSWE